MTRKMKDSGVEWIGMIPDGWSVGRVKSLFTRKDSKAQQDNPVILSLARSGVKVRDMSNNEGQIAESYYNYNPVEPGDLLLNPMDLYSGANCSISKVSGVISPAYINLKANENVNPVFYDYYFKTQYWAMAMFAHGKGVSYENRWTMGMDTLNNYFIPVPSYQEQNRIADLLDDKCAAIDDVIAKTNESIEEYKKLKQAVITEAVTKGVRGKRPMKDSGIDWIGQIPKEWDVVALRYLGQCQNGISKGAEFFGSGYPFVSYSDVYKNIELPKSVDGLVQSTDEERERYSVKRGDIFFTRTSETIEEIGFTSVCTKDIENATFAGFLIRVRPIDDSLNPDYAKYYFRSDIHRRYFVKEMIIVIRASLGQELLKKLPVLLPSKEEQREIADYLDSKCAAIDTLISKKQQFIDELTAYKKSLIYEYVTGKKEVPA